MDLWMILNSKTDTFMFPLKMNHQQEVDDLVTFSNFNV